MARLQAAASKLRESNTQLVEALEAGPDVDFSAAITENELVIVSMVV